MTIAPLLATNATSDVLELRPGGSWIAANAVALERLCDGVAPQLDRISTITLDLAGVRELDTLGAWLLEKMSRRAAAAGHRADVIGVADHYAGLIEEVHQVNRRTPCADTGEKPRTGKNR